jgi:hypothetical protein
MSKRSPARMVRRATTGALIVIAALVATLFMNGPGAGTGDDDGDAEVSSEELVASAHPEDAMLKASENPGGLTDSEQVALSGGTLQILIDEFDYFMQVPGQEQTTWEPIELSRLTKVAQQASGDSNGIRIRIQKRVTARASAEREILQQLNAVGIGADAVFESSELVE